MAGLDDFEDRVLRLTPEGQEPVVQIMEFYSMQVGRPVSKAELAEASKALRDTHGLEPGPLTLPFVVRYLKEK